MRAFRIFPEGCKLKYGLIEKDISGYKYNKLTAIRFIRRYGKSNIHSLWLFKCECGKKKEINKRRVQDGKTKSCGCLNTSREDFIKRNTTHGLCIKDGKKRPEYQVWSNMKMRCLNFNNKGYKNYGGRGIKVCKRWKDSFKNFFEDMGERPSKYHSIDRIDNNGNYEPNNCRWATNLEQGRNKRKLRLVTINGQTKCLAEWVEYYNLNQKEFNYKLYGKKMTVLQALGLE